MPDENQEKEAHEVRPFSLNKEFQSTAPPDKQASSTPTGREPRTLIPVKFTKAGEDIYASDDPSAAPVYSDFRAAVYDADADVQVIGDDEPVTPKDLSALASADSSVQSPTPDEPEMTAPVQSAIQAAAESLEGVDKDSGQPKESEPSTPTGSSETSTSPGKSEPPASAPPPTSE